MFVKLWSFWGILSLILVGWDWLLGPVLGIFRDEFFQEYLLVTIALLSFTIAMRLFEEKE